MNQLQELFTRAERTIEESIDKAWAADTVSDNVKTMAYEANELSEAFIKIGSFCHQAILNNKKFLKEKTEFELNWVNFEWISRAKEFLILWRDTIFEQQKAQILKIDEGTTLEKLETLNNVSLDYIKSAKQDLFEKVEKVLSQSFYSKTKLREWRLQQHPWTVYHKQIQTTAEQCQRLEQEHRVLVKATHNFVEIEKLVRQTETFCNNEIEHIQHITLKAIDDIKTEKLPKCAKIIQYLEEVESSFKIPHHFNEFLESLEIQKSTLVSKEEVPVGLDGGILIMKELNFRRDTEQWLDAEVLPLLYEIWELTENANNGLKMALINIKNRVILLNAEEKDGKKIELDKESIVSPLYKFLKRADNTKIELEKLRLLIDQRLKDDFNISAIYKLDRSFLTIPLQAAAMKQLRQSRGRIQDRVSKWATRQLGKIQNIRESVEKEDALSNAEKIVRLIQSRTGIKNDSSYTGIFLTKGFIGDSFAVGRKQELHHVETLINNWKKGFRGAIVITGQRFAGKTILGELIINHFFDNKTIRLTPNTLIKLNGRRMRSSFNLEESLSFIKKYAGNEPPMIWIDDLELWWDKNFPLSRNVRNLRKFIDNNSSRLFFLVSMSNWLKAHLNLFHDTSKVFQAEINVDKMSNEEITEAILIRHGATHKTLVDEEGEKISSVHFQKLIDKIYRIADGNIGEVLNRWSAATIKKSEEQVIHKGYDKYVLPDFLTPDAAIILTSIMMEKRTNEYRLRKLYGPAFTDKYAPIVQRLISIGVLIRQLDGWLEINETIVNDIGRLLTKKDYLKFQRIVGTNI